MASVRVGIDGRPWRPSVQAFQEQGGKGAQRTGSRGGAWQAMAQRAAQSLAPRQATTHCGRAALAAPRVGVSPTGWARCVGSPSMNSRGEEPQEPRRDPT
eukprot:7153786-Alexandrium_andersonii.AAC.1